MAKSDKKPRILLFGGDGGRSGVPRHIEQICETLRSSASLTVVSDQNCGGYDNVAVTADRYIQINGLRTSLRPLRLILGVWGCRRVAHQTRWDVIWLHARLPALMLRIALMIGLLRLHPQTKIVMSYHGLPFDAGHRRVAAALSHLLERMLLAWCPPMHLVFLSHDMATRLRHCVGAARLRRHRIHVLPNSSNLRPGLHPQARRNARHLVITGRAGYQKNYPLAARLMDHMPSDFVLTLCGAGTDDPVFQQTVFEQVAPDTRKRIRFVGPVVDVRKTLAGADAYLLTSRYEGMPIGAIEAFESGLPLILSPFEAAPEMVAAHPLAICLPFQDLARDAGRITRLIDQYNRNRDGQTAQIRAAWQRKYPYDVWQNRMRRLVAEIAAA